MADAETAKPETAAEDRPLIRDSKPSYDTVPATIIPEKASVLGKVRDAKAVSSGNVEYVARALPELLYCGDGCVWAIVGTLSIVYLAFIIFGAVFYNDCPREPNIPLYLVVGGTVGIVLVGINMGQQIYKQCTEEEDGLLVRLLKTGLQILRGEDEEKKAQKIATLCVELTLGIFLVAWFIAGSVWVFRVYGDYSEDKDSDKYCDKTVYMFSFVVLLVHFGILAMVLSWVVGLLCLGCCIASKINS